MALRDYLLTRTTTPTTLPVSITELQRHLRIDGDEDVDVVQANLRVAVASVEEMTGRALMPQAWKLSTHGLVHRESVYLPRPPVTAITAVSYFDAANEAQTMSVGDFVLAGDNDRASVQPDQGVNWPTTFRRPDAISVTFSAGYANASLVPEEIRAAIIMLAGHWYEHRTPLSGGEKPIPFGVEHLVGLARVGWVTA